MFIIEAQSARIELGHAEHLRNVIRRLHGAQYQALSESIVVAVELAAGLQQGSLDAEWLAPHPFVAAKRLLPEIFFAESSMFVLAPAGKRLDAWEVRRQDRRSVLAAFCEAVSTALRDSGVHVEENEVANWRPRSFQIRSADTDLGRAVDPIVSMPSAEQRAAAAALANDDARSFLVDLVRSGASISDFDDSPMAKYPSVGDLNEHGLIEREYVIVCRQDHRTLGRLTDLDGSSRQSILQLSCPGCGRRFSDELLRQVHAPSRAAMELVTDGRWRAAWATSLLEAHGITEDQITPLAGSGGRGLALRIDAAHGRLLVELPETEFGMQHAYALIRRLQRHGIALGVVLATETVSDDTYQYLNERVSRNQTPQIVVLEGTRVIEAKLREAIAEWSIVSIRHLADDLINSLGVDFGAVIEAWMRRQLVSGPQADDGSSEESATVTELQRVATSGGLT
jgi:hypothetical protein